MNTGGYTYVQVDDGKQKLWAAAPEFSVSVGDSVVVPEGMPMQNFHSPALERDFDVVYFVSEFGDHDHAEGESHGDMGGMPAGHGAMGGMGGSAAAEVTDFSDITAADQTVAAVFAEKASLAGKTVRVRGKVVKALSGIMGTNWLHVRDGSGEEGANNITITTGQMADVGDLVLVTGVLTVDKDFGMGYQYDAIIENADITVEAHDHY